MSSLGVDSPMFDFVEQINGRPVNQTPNPSPQGGAPVKKKEETKQERMRSELDRQARNLQDKDEIAEVEQIEYADENEDVDDSQLARQKFDP